MQSQLREAPRVMSYSPAGAGATHRHVITRAIRVPLPPTHFPEKLYIITSAHSVAIDLPELQLDWALFMNRQEDRSHKNQDMRSDTHYQYCKVDGRNGTCPKGRHNGHMRG